MSEIKFNNLYFSYDTNNIIFNKLSFNFDSNWRLGLIGVNGAGKTTLFKLMLSKYKYRDNIITNLDFAYFPYKVNDDLTSYEIFDTYFNNYDRWKLEREALKLDINIDTLNRTFKSLSRGEQTKILLAIMFLKDDKFLLIDEPTNFLDIDGIECLSNYLKSKRGFILVSHDRYFLDNSVDHIAYINKNRNIEITKGNFTSWYDNKTNKDNLEIKQNSKLEKEIKRLSKISRDRRTWSQKIERTKYTKHEKGMFDKGYIGHKSAKMMKSAKAVEKRITTNINKKQNLLKDIYEIEKLKINYISSLKGILINIHNLSIIYNTKIFNSISLTVNATDRVWLKGKNGSGKSSIIKMLLGDEINYTGEVFIKSNIRFSYIPQDISSVHGSIEDFYLNNNINKDLFKSILSKLSFNMRNLSRSFDTYSNGEKKKILLAKSLAEEADIYL